MRIIACNSCKFGWSECYWPSRPKFQDGGAVSAWSPARVWVCVIRWGLSRWFVTLVAIDCCRDRFSGQCLQILQLRTLVTHVYQLAHKSTYYRIRVHVSYPFGVELR